MDGWLRSNTGKKVTIYEIYELIREAQMTAITSRIIISKVSSTGIIPFYQNIFTYHVLLSHLLQIGNCRGKMSVSFLQAQQSVLKLIQRIRPTGHLW